MSMALRKQASASAWELGGRGSLRGRFFYKVLRMHTLSPPTAPLMSPGSSCGLRQGHGRLLGLLLQRSHSGPWFWDKASLRGGLLGEPPHPKHPPTPPA